MTVWKTFQGKQKTKKQINWEVPSPHVLGICSHTQKQCHAKGSKRTTQQSTGCLFTFIFFLYKIQKSKCHNFSVDTSSKSTPSYTHLNSMSKLLINIFSIRCIYIHTYIHVAFMPVRTLMVASRIHMNVLRNLFDKCQCCHTTLYDSTEWLLL